MVDLYTPTPAEAERVRDNLHKHVTNGAPAKDAPPPITSSLLFGAAIAAPLPPLEYIVREIGMVAGGGAPHLVAGYGFSGKTLAMQAMLLSLAAGRGVWGGYTGRPSKVTHVDLEQGKRLDCRRYQRLAFAMGIDLAKLGDTLALLAMPRLTLRPEYRNAWVELMTGRDLILVDSLRAATGGLDENSSEIREPLDMLGGISDETNCRPVVILHARKPSDDKPGGRYSIRGSGALYDASDCVYIFAAGKGEPVSVMHEKARTDGETVDDFALTIADLADESGADLRAGLRVQVHGAELVTDRKEAKAKAARDALARKDAETLRGVLASRPGIGAAELRALAGSLHADRFTAAKAALGDDLEIREVKNGRSRTIAHFLRGAA